MIDKLLLTILMLPLVGCNHPELANAGSRSRAQDAQRDVSIEIGAFETIEVPKFLQGKERSGQEPSIESLPPLPRTLHEIQQILFEGENLWLVANHGVIMRVDFETKIAVPVFATADSISCSRLVSPSPGKLIVLQSDRTIMQIDVASGQTREILSPLNTVHKLQVDSYIDDLGSFGDGSILLAERTIQYSEDKMTFASQVFEIAVGSGVKRALKPLQPIGNRILSVHTKVGSSVFYLEWVRSERMKASRTLAAYDRWDGTLLWTRAVKPFSNLAVSPSGTIVLDGTSRPPILSFDGVEIGVLSTGGSFAWLDSDHVLVTSFEEYNDLGVYRVSDRTYKKLGVVPIEAWNVAYCSVTNRVVVTDKNCRVVYATVKRALSHPE